MRVDEKVALTVIPAIDGLVTHSDEDVAVLAAGLDTIAAYCAEQKAKLLTGVDQRAAGLFDPSSLSAIREQREADVTPDPEQVAISHAEAERQAAEAAAAEKAKKD